MCDPVKAGIAPANSTKSSNSSASLSPSQSATTGITTPTPTTASSSKPQHIDPTNYRSERANRGPLAPNWHKAQPDVPVICLYKLVRMNVAFGISFIITPKIESLQADMVRVLMRQIFCTTDDWWSVTYEEAKAREVRTERRILELTRESKGLPATMVKRRDELLAELQ